MARGAMAGRAACVPISHPNVWSIDGELVVTWRGGSDAMSVFVSDDPVDAGTDVRGADCPGRFVVERTARRQYIHLFEPGDGFTVAAERQVVMDGPDNLRDLGGYPLAGGRQTRWGQVFRSDRLDQLTDADHQRLGELGITVVFDLRSAGEVDNAPDRLPPGVDHVHLPMSSDVSRQRSMIQRIIDGDLAQLDQADMAAGYVRMLETFGDHIGRVVSSVARGDRVLFHCTAGKDRTGVMAMILLGLTGVAEDHLLDDYEVSSRYLSSTTADWLIEQISKAGLEPAAFASMWASDRQVMKLALKTFCQRWKNHGEYLDSVGVDRPNREAAALALTHP